MKFTCDSCGAAYIISDDKIGPNGVKVRCKKCGNEIRVRRSEDVPVAPAAAPAVPAGPGGGLDDELGNAFDHAFGDPPAAAPAAAPAPAPEAPAPQAAATAPAATEWYVAIGEAQVGPLPLLEVKKRWESGDVGPDSLVWRPGMGEWGPLSNVPDLAAYLAPVPQAPRPAAAPAASVFTAPAASGPRTTAAQLRAAAPGADVEWKPAGASALAQMANEELASRAAPSPAAPAAAGDRPAAARSLMENLPDSGGVDPTGAIPLPIRGLEANDRPAHRSSVARGAEELRHKRTMRTVVVAAVLLLVAAAGGAFAYLQFFQKGSEPAVAIQAPPPAPAPAAAPAPPPPPAEPAAAGNAVAVAAPAPAPAPPPAPAPAAAPAPPPVKAAAAEPAARKPKPAAAAPAPKPAVAAATPAEKPAAKPAAKKDGVLDFDQGGDDDLAAALGGSGSGRKVYVPPAAGGAGAAADRLTDAQITESVKLHVEALRRCVSEQQAREAGSHGTVKVSWVIQQDGSPRDVRCITPEYASSPFAQCITGVVRGIRFPRIADARGQQVTFPFAF